jgi:hypothetical protein
MILGFGLLHDAPVGCFQFENDKVLVPPETAWFGYYASNSFSTILAPNEVKKTTFRTLS